MKNLIFILILISVSRIWAQKDNQTNYFNIPEAKETEAFKISFKTPVSKINYCKVGIQIENLENSFLLLKIQESKFTFNSKTFNPKPKSIIIPPNKKRTPTYKVEGNSEFIVDSFNMQISGIYQIPIEGDIIKLDNFNLPASKNTIKSDKLEVKLIKLKKKTQETYAIFEVSYYGNKVAIINESNLTVKIENGEEFSNENPKSKFKGQIILLEKGKKTKIKALFHIPAKTADMQFEKLQIIWKNTFVESDKIALPSEDILFKIDKNLTTEKNKH